MLTERGLPSRAGESCGELGVVLERGENAWSAGGLLLILLRFKLSFDCE